MPKPKQEPTHLRLRPCARLAAAGGGACTWRPELVTCDECRPAARACAIAGEWAGLSVIAAFILCLFFV